MIALCGSCMHDLRARTRWMLVDKFVAIDPVAKTVTPLQVVPREKLCDGCGRAPISARFPHATFRASIGELEMARAS